jgi:hypothetical protein
MMLIATWMMANPSERYSKKVDNLQYCGVDKVEQARNKHGWRAKWRLQYTNREQKKSIGMVSGGLAKTLLSDSRPEHIAHLICTVG